MFDQTIAVPNNPRLGAMIAVLASAGIKRNTLLQLLFLADLVYYVRFRETISHAAYWKVSSGALPEGISDALPRLLTSGVIEVDEGHCEDSGGPLYQCKNAGPAWALLTRTEFQFLTDIRDCLSGYSETYLLKIIVHLAVWRQAGLSDRIQFIYALEDPFFLDWLQDHCLGSRGWANRILRHGVDQWPAIYQASARARPAPQLEIAK